MKLLCLLGRHLRSRGQARFDGRTFISVCKRCRHPMVKDDDDVWRLAGHG